jgi:hypothetical protein
MWPAMLADFEFARQIQQQIKDHEVYGQIGLLAGKMIGMATSHFRITPKVKAIVKRLNTFTTNAERSLNRQGEQLQAMKMRLIRRQNINDLNWLDWWADPDTRFAQRGNKDRILWTLTEARDHAEPLGISWEDEFGYSSIQ